MWSAGFACAISVCLFVATMRLAQHEAKPISNDDVTAMVALGLSDDVIIEKIYAASTPEFDTSVAGLQALKAARVSDAVIRAMINPHAPPTVPSDAGAAKFDPNDPNTPHDPGIYMYAKTRDGMRMFMLEPTVYQGGSSGGAFKSAMTYGIAKIKWKAVVQGAHANLKSSDAALLFYFYFEASQLPVSATPHSAAQPPPTNLPC